MGLQLLNEKHPWDFCCCSQKKSLPAFPLGSRVVRITRGWGC